MPIAWVYISTCTDAIEVVRIDNVASIALDQKVSKLNPPITFEGEHNQAET